MSRVSRLARPALGLVVLGTAVGGGWWLAGGSLAASGLGASAASGDGGGESAEVKTAPVERRTLTITEELEATLGYAAEYEVIGGLDGTLTWSVGPGTVVGSGQPLYEVNGRDRASLMLGRRPAWRTLEDGVSDGYDVRQLEENLLLLGHTRSGEKIDRHWDDDTTAAVKRWQKAAGLPVDGVLRLGEIVFLNEPIRVTGVEASLGSRVGGGAPILAGTSNRQVVSLDLDAADHDLVAVGDAVTVELPDGTTLDGAIASIGTVAESTSDQQGGSSTTLPVTVTLDDPSAAGGLDSAPVEVVVVTERREDVLTVPVSALVALLEGGYAVEVLDGTSGPGASLPPGASPPSQPASRLVAVEPGLFDRGYVEVTATGLEPGQLVVVPS